MRWRAAGLALRLQAWLQRWAQRYPRLTDWVETHIGETLNKHLKSTSLLERLNDQIERLHEAFPSRAFTLLLRFRPMARRWIPSEDVAVRLAMGSNGTESTVSDRRQRGF